MNNPDEIIRFVAQRATLVAVTKTFPFETVRRAHEAGCRHMGENRVEEAAKKIELARHNNLNDITWHMIGHIQSRKAATVALLFDRVDSVDSLEHADALNNASQRAGKALRILLEVNVSGEASKFGFPLSGWANDTRILDMFLCKVERIQSMNNLIVEGLMTMAPFVIHPEKNRTFYRDMQALSNTLRMRFPSFGAALSMGTSCDWRVALKEGATEIRLGEALFGKRNV